MRSIVTGALCSLLIQIMVNHSCYADDIPDMLDLPLEDLLKMDVGVLNRGGGRLLESSAAIAVVTAEDIRRSRATTIPEVLRLVPGVSVARLFGGAYSVGIRGNQGRFADKILILMDGRPVYTPEFGGISWEAFDMYLPDIERIEVIRGPGASLWGTNAINGIISIITKRALGGERGQAYASLGNTFRSGIGGSFDTNILGRAVRFSLNRQGIRNDRFGVAANGNDNQNQGNFTVRMDTEDGPLEWATQLRGTLSSLDNIRVQQGILEKPIYGADIGYPGGNDIAQLGYLLPARNTQYVVSFQQSVQRMYAGRPKWRLLYGITRQRFEDAMSGAIIMHTIDVDAYARDRVGKHDILYGFSGKGFSDSWNGGYHAVSLANKATTKVLGTAFLQDSISLFDDKAVLTLGTKVQVNQYTGFEYEPSIRISSQITKDCALWAAWSRAVRIPNRINRGLYNYANIGAPSPVFGPYPIDFRVTTDPKNVIASEVLDAHEAGIRGETNIGKRRLTWDVSLFYNHYKDLVGTPLYYITRNPQFLVQPTVHALAHLDSINLYPLNTWGDELQATLQITRGLKLTGWYSGLYADDDFSRNNLGLSPSRPKHQAMMKVSATPWEGGECDITLRTNTVGFPSFSVVDNRALDVRLSYAATNHITYELLGIDLLHRSHIEGYTPPGYDLRPAATLQRGVIGRISYTW